MKFHQVTYIKMVFTDVEMTMAYVEMTITPQALNQAFLLSF